MNKDLQCRVLPDEFADQLAAMYTKGRGASPQLCAAIAQASAKGWTYQAIATVLDVSREYPRQLAEKAIPGLALPFDIPEPPPKPPKEYKQWPQLTPAQATYLRHLNAAAKATGRMHPNHPAVRASREVAKLLQQYLDAGHRRGDLAKAMGVSGCAIHFRLGRNGYRKLPPSQKFKPGPLAGADPRR